ncbi:hypothetical protein K439DRAFT_1621173 [Ramaria rubella]|nr:hypothetical protein K439DRAFT_1621173 [Ramaria rubella]
MPQHKDMIIKIAKGAHFTVNGNHPRHALALAHTPLVGRNPKQNQADSTPDATNILQTKRERRAPVNPYAQDDKPTSNKSVDIPNVPKLDAKTLCFEVDDNYQDDGKEDFEEAMIEAPENKAPVKASRSPKQAPPDPKEVYIHVPYLNGNGQEVTARFFVPVTVTKLEDVATTIIHHIN